LNRRISCRLDRMPNLGLRQGGGQRIDASVGRTRRSRCTSDSVWGRCVDGDPFSEPGQARRRSQRRRSLGSPFAGQQQLRELRPPAHDPPAHPLPTVPTASTSGRPPVMPLKTVVLPTPAHPTGPAGQRRQSSRAIPASQRTGPPPARRLTTMPRSGNRPHQAETASRQCPSPSGSGTTAASSFRTTKFSARAAVCRSRCRPEQTVHDHARASICDAAQ